jgi:hypothetical protein
VGSKIRFRSLTLGGNLKGSAVCGVIVNNVIFCVYTSSGEFLETLCYIKAK